MTGSFAIVLYLGTRFGERTFNAMASSSLALPLVGDGAWDALAHSILVITVGYLLMTATRLSGVLIQATITETGQLATPGAVMGVLLKMFLQELQDQYDGSLLMGPLDGVLWTLGLMGARSWLLGQRRRGLSAQGKSLSCPALMENLQSPGAVVACTDMLAEFERHHRGRPFVHAPDYS